MNNESLFQWIWWFIYFLSVITYFLEPQDSNDLQNAPIIRRSEVESLHFWVPRLRLTRHPLFITIIPSAIEKRPYAHTAWQVGTQLRRNAPLFLFISSFSLLLFFLIEHINLGKCKRRLTASLRKDQVPRKRQTPDATAGTRSIPLMEPLSVWPSQVELLS